LRARIGAIDSFASGIVNYVTTTSSGVAVVSAGAVNDECMEGQNVTRSHIPGYDLVLLTFRLYVRYLDKIRVLFVGSAVHRIEVFGLKSLAPEV
jgi:hypothetical protein